MGPTPYGFAFTSGGVLVVSEAFRAEKGAAAAAARQPTGTLILRSDRLTPAELADRVVDALRAERDNAGHG